MRDYWYRPWWSHLNTLRWMIWHNGYRGFFAGLGESWAIEANYTWHDGPIYQIQIGRLQICVATP